MNSTLQLDPFYEVFIKNFISVFLGVIINYINGTFVFVFFKDTVFCSDPRYILYIHLVINDMLALTIAVLLQVSAFAFHNVSALVCSFVLLFTIAINKNGLLNLACMAIERYIAVCNPLHHPVICTVRRTYILIWLIWTLSAVPAFSDIFITLSINPTSFLSTIFTCQAVYIYNTWQHTVKDIVLNAVYLSFVWITLIVTYFKVFAAANAASADRVSARKAQNTILLHGFQLLLCMISYLTPLLGTALVKLFPQSRTVTPVVLFLVSSVLPRLLSPLIYGLRDKRFSEHIKVYLLCKQVRKHIPMK